MPSPRRPGVPETPAHDRKSSLSPARSDLIARMGALGFGRFANLQVRGGDPVFDRNTVVVRTLKMGGRNEPREEVGHGDFPLKGAVVELFEHLDRLGDGVIARLEVAHGLPLVVEVVELREPVSA